MAEDPDIPSDLKNKITRLQELKTRRAAARKKLDALHQFQDFIHPIKDPQSTVQPSLVTRDGPLAEELARSKTLGIRVAGRVAGLDVGGDGDEDVDMIDQDEKVRSILERH
jgi:hypothetical protein